MVVGLRGIVGDLSELAEDLACPRHDRHNSLWRLSGKERIVLSPPSLSNGVTVISPQPLFRNFLPLLSVCFPLCVLLRLFRSLRRSRPPHRLVSYTIGGLCTKGVESYQTGERDYLSTTTNKWLGILMQEVACCCGGVA